ncbi:FtsW/RodA/SpoVE family cell cycle protein [Lactococcus carnosus]|uniref:Probable peptidoglycan glycosyltransferase FtsW n=1 Tax=Pseudolactococcus carnosus TaxID=2749961 RepID=A0ABT0ATA6_9LACT|nr:FtsW/RodA/SpoVE family cell cycle protein [Lactococcus carnosus]SCA92554.1 Lipid II flippase FtsW [Lactococcus piscium]MCJ1969443.1 FtsW/RodA/SpoVE family cell cycle protein [Lactococcus carnosus]MCJ1974013.1 FtsW/RodA/SpoVE family cell cycle protein [Lactococcus carnosus]MCJ1975405.1 FtsW/RodA/SpoVE family cell cycle protein [Lactococcus carnosus]MCJ1982097.1 FtsW/RodA/SpoVE family cell cycle protein [Lactococcus carnosus]
MKELNKRHFLNYSILIPYLILSVLGLIIVFSTTVPHQIELGLPPYQLFRNQTIFFVFSLVMIAMIYKMKVDKLRSRGWFGILIPIMLALLFIARFLAPPINGAHGWIPIPGIGTIQPAEYLKLVSVWFLAATFAAKQKKIKDQDIDALFNRKQFFINFISGWRLWMVLMVGAVVVMPDMGNALLILISAAIVLATSGISYRWTTGFLKIFGIFSLIALVILKITGGNIIPSIFGSITYVNKRFIAFANPFQDSSDSGHQMINGYYAMSNGGWFGRGLGNSIEKKGYLPEAHTDFVFAIVMEELGLIGGMIILGLIFFLIMRIFMVGIRAKDPFNSMMSIGVGGIFFAQVLVNIGGIAGLIPSTGVTFPFLSQGGNSLLILSVGIGFVLNISADEKRRELAEITSKYDLSELSDTSLSKS